MKKSKVQPAEWKTTKKERRAYLTGDMGRLLEGQIITTFMSTFLVFQGINLTAVAGVMLLVKIIDALDDVVFGYLVDRINVAEWKLTKKIAGEGKYLPWYRLLFLFYPLFTCMFFLMPRSIGTAGKLIWFVVFYLLYDFSYTLVEVPMNSMIVTLTDQTDERDSILQVKSILSMAGTFGAALIGMVLISESVGFSIRSVALVGSVIFLVMMLPLAISVREHNTVLANTGEDDNKRYSLRDMLECVKTNKYLLVLLLSSFLYNALATEGALGSLVGYYLFGNSLAIALPIIISFAPVLIVISQTKKICERFGKLRVCIIFGLIGGLIRLSIFFIGPAFIAFTVLLVLQAPFSNVSLVAKNFFLPDTIEYTRYKTGKDCAGIMTSINSFVTKLTSSISSSLGLFILGLSNFIPVEAESFEDLAAAGVQQPAQALSLMWVVYALIPVVGILLSVVVMFLYKLSDKDAQLMAKCNAGEITREECEALLSKKY